MKRFLTASLAWGLLFCASPGVLVPDGSALLAVLGVAIWGLVASRDRASAKRASVPGAPRAGLLGFLAEWAAASLGWGGIVAWVWYVVPGGLAFMGLGMGLYAALAGWCLRLLLRRVPLALAIPLAWMATETLRSVLPPPLGLGWLRLGHHAHASLWLSGSARVWGVEGLSFVLAAAAGALAAVLAQRALRVSSLLIGGLPIALGALLAVATSAPETVAGPRLLLVQPGFEQQVKMYRDPYESFVESRQQTAEALAEQRQSGAPPVDLVCWGETMLGLPLFEPGVEEALREGLELPSWWSLRPEHIPTFRRHEEEWVGRFLFGHGGLPGERGALDPGSSFLTGVELYAPAEGMLHRYNAVVLYDAEGRRSGFTAKRWLVPGAETLSGFERWAWARAFAKTIADYVPDFRPAAETGVLELKTAAAGRFRFGSSVCFDNAFLGPYVEPLAREDLDFHLVVSNEAWYRNSWEVDQMVAFSRIAALATGRSMVRATNSGASLALGPDGRELGRIRVGGRDRLVRGSLAITVPVPSRGGAEARSEGPFEAAPTAYVRWFGSWRLAWIALPWLLALVACRRSGNRPFSEG